MVWFLLNRRTGEAGGADFGTITDLAKRRIGPIFPDTGGRYPHLFALGGNR